MKRFYRIEHNATPRHVVEENTVWRLVEGDIFGRYQTGDQITANGRKPGWTASTGSATGSIASDNPPGDKNSGTAGPST